MASADARRAASGPRRLLVSARFFPPFRCSTSRPADPGVDGGGGPLHGDRGIDRHARADVGALARRGADIGGTGGRGGPSRDGNRCRYVGAELDLLANYQITRHLLGYAGYSHFFTGAFINRSGPGRDSDFVYAALQYTFCARRADPVRWSSGVCAVH